MLREFQRPSLGFLMAAGLLILGGALLYFYRLDQPDLHTRIPAKIAVYARQMNLDQSWLAPVLRGQPRVDVPPLYLWAVQLASGFSDKVEAYDVRVPGALSSLLLALLAAAWLYRHITRYSRDDIADAPPEGFALLMGLLVATNPTLFDLGRSGTLDAMFTLIYAAAAFCWGESLEARRSFYAGQSWRTWILWGYLLAGVAMLVRGPIVIPLILVPYLLAARSYRLRGLDRVHLWGALLMLAIGCSWPLLVGLKYPAAGRALWHNLLTFQLGTQIDHPVKFYYYLRSVLTDAFPWIILAAIMTVRVWLKKDRSPTLVFWASSLIGNLFVLTFLSFYVGQHLLPVMIFALLLAGDSIYHWHYENRWARAWRIILRISLLIALAAGIFLSALISSSIGMTLFILVAAGWLIWVIYARVYSLEFTPWETTIRLSAMTVLLIVAVEGVILNAWVPSQRFHVDRLTYMTRVQERLPDPEDQPLYLYDSMSILYDYYFGPLPNIHHQLAQIPPTTRPAYLFAEEDIPALLRNPRLDPQTFLRDDDSDTNEPREAMFRMLPAAAAPTTGTTATTATVAQRTPLRVALLGNSGTRRKDQREVARQLTRETRRRPLDDILLLGNNLYGPTFFDHLGFVKTFEDPYEPILKRGVVFHAALGHEDQSYGWLQTRYVPFHMNGRRYYRETLHGGLLDIFMLDSETLYDPATKTVNAEQLNWLKGALAASRAPWKVVGLWRALAGVAAENAASQALAGALLPLFDQYGVHLVAWSGGQWYARHQLPGHAPVLLNCGWSGDVDKSTTVQNAPTVQVAANRRPGFVLLYIRPDRILVQAINDRADPVDRFFIRHSPTGAPVVEAAPPAGANAPGAPGTAPATAPTPAVSQAQDLDTTAPEETETNAGDEESTATPVTTAPATTGTLPAAPAPAPQR